MPGVEGRVIYGSESGAARGLTTTYDPTDASPGYEHVPALSQACLLFILNGTVPTSIEWKVQLSHDANTWFDELTEEVSAGTVTQLVAVRSLPPNEISNKPARYSALVPLPPGVYFRIVAKRTGGDSGTTLLATATIGRV